MGFTLPPTKILIIGVILPIVVISWIFAVAASSSNWYQLKESSVSFPIICCLFAYGSGSSAITATTSISLLETTEKLCFGSTCESASASWNIFYYIYKISLIPKRSAPSSSHTLKINNATRALLIIGIILNSFEMVIVIALAASYFVPKLDAILTLKLKLIYRISMVPLSIITYSYTIQGLTVACLVFYLLAWAVYLGMTAAFKSDTTSVHMDVQGKPKKCLNPKDSDIFWVCLEHPYSPFVVRSIYVQIFQW